MLLMFRYMYNTAQKYETNTKVWDFSNYRNISKMGQTI